VDVTRTATGDDAPQPTPWPIHLAGALEVRDPARYEVLGEHGRGGIGRVLRAYDKQLGRSVAIKELIKRGGINEVRFAREAMITARLEHPGIVPVHDAGRWPDGTPFYVMKLVAGRSLKELIDERRAVDERLGLLHHVIAVANAVAYAHGRGIIHRDLKPSNVIAGDFGETVVIDWGLAKELHTGDDEPLRTVAHVELTDAGSVVGTPMYMSPEQTRGDYVDQRTDVYAIGAMLWELCSFARAPAAAAAQRKRLMRDGRVALDLVAIITRALAFDPAARYRDAGELAAELEALD
jgi:serine/threonine protein kinase